MIRRPPWPSRACPRWMQVFVVQVIPVTGLLTKMAIKYFLPFAILGGYAH